MNLEQSVFLARVAEQAERFDDMVLYLQEMAIAKTENFTTEERNLLSVGFKNQIGSKRTAIRTICAIEQNPKYSKFAISLEKYKSKIEKELHDQCLSIIEIVKTVCQEKATSDESKAFFLKMIGDYFRYVAESVKDDKVKEQALAAYQEATLAVQTLGACDPIRLGLALNFSVFKYEIMNDKSGACVLGE